MRWSGLLRVSCSLCGPRHRGLEYALSRAAAAELPAATERLPAAWDVRSTRGAEVLPSRGIDASKFARGAPLCARARRWTGDAGARAAPRDGNTAYSRDRSLKVLARVHDVARCTVLLMPAACAPAPAARERAPAGGGLRVRPSARPRGRRPAAGALARLCPSSPAVFVRSVIAFDHCSSSCTRSCTRSTIGGAVRTWYNQAPKCIESQEARNTQKR
eukprot:COSAG02_NODE_7745_length_2864_cov_3.574684_2_plen_217_part_00